MEKLKKKLDKIYKKYNRKEYIGTDPLIFVYNYSNSTDQEIIAFFASALAYGRVALIQAALTRLFDVFGASPTDFVLNFNSRQEKRLSDFKYRFNVGQDISEILWVFKDVLGEYGSLEKFFLQGYSDQDADIIPSLQNFTQSLLDRIKTRTKCEPAKGVQYLLANPKRKSPCKRLNLFLRWMVRADDVDLGLWKSVSPSKLIVPLDTHMTRLCKIIGLYDVNTVSLKTACDITQKFAEICPEDPVRYDFSLCRIGIVDNCTGKFSEKCARCELASYCKSLA